MLFRKKTSRILLLIILAAIFVSGCNNKPVEEKTDTITGQLSQSSNEIEADVTKEPVNVGDGNVPEITSKAQMPADQVINNGGLFVKYNGYIYYRQYNAESFEATGLWGYYAAVTGVSKNMMRLKDDGTAEIAFSDDGAGNIYISNDRMYLQKPTENGDLIYSVNLDGSNPKDIGNGNIMGIDPASGTLVCIFQNEKLEKILATVNGTSGEITDLALTVPCDNVLAVRDGFIYYNGVVDYEESAYGKMKFCRVAVDGTNELLLAESDADLYDFETYGTEIPCIQFVDDTIYFSYGGYAGSGDYYQGGIIAKVNKDGSDFEVLVGRTMNSDGSVSDGSEAFYVTNDNGKRFLYYDDDAKDEEIYKLGLSKGKVTTVQPIQSDRNVNPEGVPFEYNGGVSVYQNASPSIINLIPKVDYSSLGIDSTLDYHYVIKDIEQVGNWVYYRLDANEYSEEASIGWRDGYRRIKAQVIREEIGGGKKEILFEY